MRESRVAVDIVVDVTLGRCTAHTTNVCCCMCVLCGTSDVVAYPATVHMHASASAGYILGCACLIPYLMTDIGLSR